MSLRTTLLAALLATTALGVAPGAHATDWTPTATRAIGLGTLTGAVDLGALSASQPLTVRLGLQMQHKAAALALLRQQSDPTSASYGQFLTPAQFAQGFAPSSAQVAAVTGYLKSAGFTNITVEPNSLLVSADGTAAMAQAAFNTTLEQVSIAGRTLFVNTAAASVPAALGGLVTAVLGLNTVGTMRPSLALPTAPQIPASFTPQQFQQLYSAAPVIPACCTQIAIMAEGDLTGVVSDLRIAEAAFGLPYSPVTIRQVGLASPDVSGADEWDLDSQSSTGIATAVKMLYLYDTTSLSDSDTALEFSKWVSDDVTRAASASFGECEAFPYIDGAMVVDDETFLEAAVQGQTMFASAGDTGSFCPVGPAAVNGVPAGAPFVNYPASSPYVVAVGGTTLLANADGNYNTEIAWYAGGGGLSAFEGSPFWQAQAVTALGTANMRGVPDIAMDADPNTGATVYVNGVAETVGGTSLSSPLALGSWARTINTDWKLGFASPSLYSLYDGTGLVGAYPNGGFHDIIVGANGAYTAGPGYDLTTGLGSFIINQLTTALGH